MIDASTARTTTATASWSAPTANWAATAISTIPSSIRSSVESRKAPNGEPLPDIRE